MLCCVRTDLVHLQCYTALPDVAKPSRPKVATHHAPVGRAQINCRLIFCNPFSLYRHKGTDIYCVYEERELASYLVFYAQSTITVISGQKRERVAGENNRKQQQQNKQETNKQTNNNNNKKEQQQQKNKQTK